MLSELVKTYIAGREQAKLEKHDKETESKQAKLPEAEKPEYIAKQQSTRAEIQVDYKPVNWLTDAAKRASQIQLATHAPKYTHGDAKSSSVNASEIDGVVGRVGTHSLDNLAIDVTGNAAALDVANLLLLSDGTETLWRQLVANNAESLQEFSASDGQLAEWITGLSVAIKGAEFSTHSLGKQVYFPLDEGDYHLLTPLFPTSLCHELYRFTQHTRFSEESKSARECRKNNKTSEDDVVRYLGMAEMSFGGSKPQNISLLNSQRRGTAYLLSSAPPTWKDQISLPIKGRAALWRSYRRRVYGPLKALNHFLDKVEHYTNDNIRSTRRQMVTGLVDEWLTMVATIRRAASPGWSMESDLPLHEQCLLDPDRRDENENSAFHQMLDTGEWRKRVAEDFALWLNRALGKKGKRDLGDAEAAVWATELNDVLSSTRNDLERFL